CPPRAVCTPRVFRASAISRSVRAPARLISCRSAAASFATQRPCEPHRALGDPVAPSVPIRRAFDAETIERMSEALKGVYEPLSLTLVDSPETRLVAQKIIELAQSGVRDVAALQAMTLSEFK